MNKKHDLPSMPFYVGDWLKCPEVRALAPDHRGLWFDLICYMWESSERGVMIKSNGKPYSDNEIIRMVGLDNLNSGFWLTSLLDNGVCCRREDGAIFSKRMVKEEKIRVLRRELGKKGGNPLLLVNQIVNREVKLNTEYENENENEVINKKNIKCTKREKAKKTADDDLWLEDLKQSETYKHVNFDLELGKMKTWLDAHPGRRLTRRFIINWINKIETTIQTKGGDTNGANNNRKFRSNSEAVYFKLTGKYFDDSQGGGDSGNELLKTQLV